MVITTESLQGYSSVRLVCFKSICSLMYRRDKTGKQIVSLAMRCDEQI